MLFSPLFLPDRLRDAVAEAAWIQAMLDAEAALVRAEAQAGVIPMAAAEEIVRYCLAETSGTGYWMVPVWRDE